MTPYSITSTFSDGLTVEAVAALNTCLDRSVLTLTVVTRSGGISVTERMEFDPHSDTGVYALTQAMISRVYIAPERKQYAHKWNTKRDNNRRWPDVVSLAQCVMDTIFFDDLPRTTWGYSKPVEVE